MLHKLENILEKKVKRKMKSAYIHIPFCEHLCFYCDFNKVFLKGQPVDEYIDRLLQEIQMVRQKCKDEEKLQTIYIGGGTPTSLTALQLDHLLSGIQKLLPLEEKAEFTIEANPGDLTADKLSVFQTYGINRISLGVQTFDDHLLKKIGRKHTAADVFHTIELIHNEGFSNVSIDLIYALPNQTLESYEHTLDQAIALDLPHYSLYSLILENQTVFANLARKGKLPLPGQDIEAEMFELTQKKMQRAGLHQYEISNFSKVGKESRHNLVYWNNEHYYGFGAGASGYYGSSRYRNHGPIQHYLQPLREGKLPLLEVEQLTLHNQMEEEMFLGLRKKAGVSLAKFEEKFDQSLDEVYGEVVAELLQRGLVETNGESLWLSDQGLPIGNEVFQQFLIDD